MNISDLPQFLKSLKEFFYQLKSKNCSDCQFAKCYLMYNMELGNIIEILKEELNSYKFYTKAQSVQSTVIETTSWFMYLYPDLYIQSFESLL